MSTQPHKTTPIIQPGDSPSRIILRFMRHDPRTIVAVTIFFLLVVTAALANPINQALDVNPNRTNLTDRFLPIGAPDHPLGTDDLGRDFLARLLLGGQVTLGLSAAAAALSFAVGVPLGILAGYFGSTTGDDLFNWVISTIEAIPILLFIICVLVSPGPESLALILGLYMAVNVSRMVRNGTQLIVFGDYILAARGFGASRRHIMMTHLLPNVLVSALIIVVSNFVTIVLLESSLSFLGIGVRPPTPTWGNLLTNAQTYLLRGPHLLVLPGVLITIVVLCLEAIADRIRSGVTVLYGSRVIFDSA